MLLFILNLDVEITIPILDLFESNVKILTQKKTIGILQSKKTIDVLQSKKTIRIIN